jgi:hypothetical protein
MEQEQLDEEEERQLLEVSLDERIAHSPVRTTPRPRTRNEQELIIIKGIEAALQRGEWNVNTILMFGQLSVTLK